MGTSSGVYELNHDCASKSDLISRTRTSTYFIIALKHGYRCFIL